jgi:biopolymer transport protein ExbB
MWILHAWEWLVHRFNEGGFFMWFILFTGLYAAYLLSDRLYHLYFKIRPVPKDTRQTLRTFLQAGDLKGAQEYVQGQKSTPFAKVVGLACQFKADGAADDELQSRVDEALTEAVGTIDRRTSFLAVIGNVATLIGLLGTISGMITSFAAVSGATAAERATMLSMGISEAMNCTAFGLLVAIPALVGYAAFQNKTEALIRSLTENVSKVYNDLIYLYEPTRLPSKRT